MTAPNEKISFQPVKVRVDGQSGGMLVFADGALVAVLVRLDEAHGELEGRWYAEAAFNSLERMDERTFESLGEASDWIVKWLDHK